LDDLAVEDLFSGSLKAVCSASSNPFDAAMCELCDQGRSFDLSVKCVGCQVQYGAQVSVFSLDYSIDPLNLYTRVEARVDAHINAAVDIQAHLQLAQQLAGTLEVLDEIPIPPSISIELGVVTIVIGATFDLKAGYTLDLAAEVHAEAQARVSNTITAHALYDSRIEPAISFDASSPPFTWGEEPTVTMAASGHVHFELAPSAGGFHPCFAPLNAHPRSRCSLLLECRNSLPTTHTIPHVQSQCSCRIVYMLHACLRHFLWSNHAAASA
jgi:hypothetical protein